MTGINFFKGNDGYQGDYTTWTGDGSQNATMEFGTVGFDITASGSAAGATYDILDPGSANYQYIVQNLVIYNVGPDVDSYYLEIYRRLGSNYSAFPICQAHTIAPEHSFQFFSKDAPLIVGDYRNSSTSWANVRVRAMGGLSQTSRVFASFIRHKE